MTYDQWEDELGSLLGVDQSFFDQHPSIAYFYQDGKTPKETAIAIVPESKYCSYSP